MLNDPAAIMILGDSRGVPMSSIGYNTLVKENKFNAVDKKAIDQIRKAKIDIPSPYFEHNRIQELVRSIFEGVSLGQLSDDEAANRLINETNQALRSLK